MASSREKGGGVTGEFVDNLIKHVGGVDVVAERAGDLYLQTSDKYDPSYSVQTATRMLKIILDAFKNRDSNVYTEHGLDLSDPEVTDALKGFAIEEVRTNPDFRLQLVAIAIEADPNVVGAALDITPDRVLIGGDLVSSGGDHATD